jgi:Na+/melibiose symporter-like transporter
MIFGFLGIILAVIGFLVIDEKKIKESAPSCVSGENGEKNYDIADSLKIIFSDSQFFWLSLFAMTTFGPVAAFSDAWGMSFIKNIYGIDRLQAASMLGMIYFGTVAGIPLVAFLDEKFKNHKKIMISGSLILFVLLTAAVFIKFSIIFLGILLFLTGVAASCEFLAFPTALEAAPREIGGTLTGVINTAAMFGGSLLIWLVGRITDFSRTNFGISGAYSPDDYRNGVIVLPLTVIIAIASLYFVKTTPRKNSV